MTKIFLGITIGMILISAAEHFGEKRYSEAIRKCVTSLGLNGSK